MDDNARTPTIIAGAVVAVVFVFAVGAVMTIRRKHSYGERMVRWAIFGSAYEAAAWVRVVFSIAFLIAGVVLAVWSRRPWAERIAVTCPYQGLAHCRGPLNIADMPPRRDAPSPTVRRNLVC